MIDRAVPPWLATMRQITGTLEAPGSADNPVILGWAKFIGDLYSEMRAYCAQYTQMVRARLRLCDGGQWHPPAVRCER